MKVRTFLINQAILYIPAERVASGEELATIEVNLLRGEQTGMHLKSIGLNADTNEIEILLESRKEVDHL